MESPSSDPREWTKDQVHEFAQLAEPKKLLHVLRTLATNADDASIDVLIYFLGSRDASTYLKPIPSQLALRALISIGKIGVSRVFEALIKGNLRIRYQSTVLSVLWFVGRGCGFVAMDDRVPPDLTDLVIPDGTPQSIIHGFRAVFAESKINNSLFTAVSGFISDLNNLSNRNLVPKHVNLREEFSFLMKMYGEGFVKLTNSVLEEFSKLISEQCLESRYQTFFADNPVLLEPLAAEVVPKQRLGVEYATDFAIRNHDNSWTLVEIERPQDDIFTKGNDFRERFTHAFGQVLDFQHWVDDNISYAQKHMPKIISPRGLLVMGLRSRLTARQQEKLRRFSENSMKITIVTYDDVLERSRLLYANMHQSLM